MENLTIGIPYEKISPFTVGQRTKEAGTQYIYVPLYPCFQQPMSNLCQQTRCTRILKSPGYHGNIVTYP